MSTSSLSLSEDARLVGKGASQSIWPSFSMPQDVQLAELQRAELVRARSAWNPRRARVADWFESNLYEWLVGVLILINVILIIYDTDQRADDGLDRAWLQGMGILYLLLYALDAGTKLFVYRRAFFHSTWNNLDLFVVVSDIVAICLESIIGNVPSFGALRICRVFRLVRALRVVRIFRELDTMLTGFLSAMRAMFWASIMLVIMTTLWSIVAVEVLHPVNVRVAERGDYEGCERCIRAYSSVLTSNLTFMQQILAGDSWGLVSIPIIEEEPLSIIIFFAVFVCINMGLLNLVLTVIVDVANPARDADEQRRVADRARELESAKASLIEICQELDSDGSGHLSLRELERGMDTSLKFSRMMAYMDVAKSDMHLIFSVLDEDNSGLVSYTEFIEQLYRLKSQDVHTMLVFIRGYVNEVRSKVTESLGIVRDELRGEVKSLWEQSHALIYGKGMWGDEDRQRLRVRIEDDTRFGGVEDCGSDVYCTCEIVGKPLTRICTEVGVQEDASADEALEGYTSGDSLLFCLWSRAQAEKEKDAAEESEDRLIGRAIVRGDDLAKGAEQGGFTGDLRFRAQGGEELPWRPRVVTDTPTAMPAVVKSDDELRARRLGLMSLDEDKMSRHFALLRDLAPPSFDGRGPARASQGEVEHAAGVSRV